MRQTLFLLGGLCAVSALGFVLFFFREGQMSRTIDGAAAVAGAASSEPEEEWGSSPGPELSAVKFAAPADRREPVAVPESPGRVEADPCAAIIAALATVRLELQHAQSDLNQLRRKLGDMRFELELCKSPEDTPYGAFLASNEFEQIMEMLDGVMYQKKLSKRALASGRKPPKPEPAGEFAVRGIKACLKEFPIFLLPGEATWIAERYVSDDWKYYAPMWEPAIIQFLGPARLAAELPEARLAELREDYAEEGIFD